MARGACRDVADPSIFFDDDGRNMVAKLNVTEAKRVCTQECDQRISCLAYALEAGIDDGVWGGTTGEERRRMRSKRRVTLVSG